MRSTIAIVAALVLFIVLFVTVLGDGDGADECLPESGSSHQRVDAGVPDGEFSLPENNALDHVTSGWRTASRPGHKGVDIAQGQGSPLYAFADGIVVSSGVASGFGQWIVIDHKFDGELYSTVYGHIFPQDLLVDVGEEVKAGDHIANEGYNGEVSPPGPGGSHLHFEVWKGGRHAGGVDVDPMPWLEKAVEPGTGAKKDRDKDSDKDTAVSVSNGDGAGSPGRRGSAKELEESPVFNENNLQVDTIRVGRAVAELYPEIEVIGGWRPVDNFDDHPSGRAADIMIPSWQTVEGKALGDEIFEYLWANREAFNVEYFIWRQELTPVGGEAYIMADQGSPTLNHYDHIHVTTVGGGYPKVGQKYGPAPTGGKGRPGSASRHTGDGCDPLIGVDADLAAGEIPEEYREWISRAGSLCREITPPVVAGVLYQESGFKTGLVSSTGALGPGQFMPGTWAAVGAKVDENGEVVGSAGSGDPNHIPDAVMASGRYLCEIAEQMDGWLAEGKISGDPLLLTLAGYNAGPYAVLKYGGYPPYDETQGYIKLIPEHIERFSKQ